MHILIVDDDMDSCESMTIILQSTGYMVSCAYRGSAALRLIHDDKPDMIILDARLPDVDGFNLCRLIRTFSNIPIVMISAIARDEYNMIHGLDTGADEYLLKPIQPQMLLAKIRTLLRRYHEIERQHAHKVTYIDSYLMIDIEREEVRIKGQFIKLSPLEFQLLETLVLNSNHAVPTVQLMERNWPHLDLLTGDSDSVHACVRRLRKKIEPDPHNPQYVVTEYGFGYRFSGL